MQTCMYWIIGWMTSLQCFVLNDFFPWPCKKYVNTLSVLLTLICKVCHSNLHFSPQTINILYWFVVNIYKSEKIMHVLYIIGVKVRNMKMDFDIYGTWRWVGQWILMMKIYDFFIRLSRLVTQYNIVQKSLRRWKIFLHNIIWGD